MLNTPPSCIQSMCKDVNQEFAQHQDDGDDVRLSKPDLRQQITGAAEIAQQ